MNQIAVDTNMKRDPSAFELASPAIRIAPSLLSADFSHLEEDVARVERGGAKVLHLDVMDGHFVPNLSFGASVIKAIRPASNMFFDAHLMIQEPMRYAEAFVEAGCDLITFHIEATDSPMEVVRHIRGLGASVGVSLNPTTPIDALDAIIDEVDMVLVMSVWPGHGGQKVIPAVLTKVELLRDRLDTAQRLEIDGGINPATIESAKTAGADTFVAGTAVFGQADPVMALHRLCEIAESARPDS